VLNRTIRTMGLEFELNRAVIIGISESLDRIGSEAISSNE
jgi:hypothetical protein